MLCESGIFWVSSHIFIISDVLLKYYIKHSRQIIINDGLYSAVLMLNFIQIPCAFSLYIIDEPHDQYHVDCA